jgi:DNA-binding Lrp family transcriptional regulator
MAPTPAKSAVSAHGQANFVLDATDRAIVRLLSAEGRMPNNALAEAVGIAPSTCLGRVRALVEHGVIRGFHADVDPASVGLGIQVLIAVRLQADARASIGTFARDIARLPGVMNVFFLGGADDFIIHAAAANTDALRDFVAEHLSRRPDVANTVTNLIFEHTHSSAFV